MFGEKIQKFDQVKKLTNAVFVDGTSNVQKEGRMNIISSNTIKNFTQKLVQILKASSKP